MKHTKKGFKLKDHNRNGSSRSTASSSNSNGGKPKEGRSFKPPDTSEESALSFPDLRIIDNNKFPCYLAILSTPKEEVIGIDHLDNMQLELEMLLSAVAVRNRELQNEIIGQNSSDDNSKDKDGKTTTNKTVTKKEEKSVLKLPKPTKDLKLINPVLNPVRAKSRGLLEEEELLPDHLIPELAISADPSKVMIPKIDTPNKFWAHVDAFCCDITPEHVQYLEDLIANCEKDAEISKVPSIGKHYTLRWADEEIRDEKLTLPIKKKKASNNSVSTSNQNIAADDIQSDNNAINNNTMAASIPKGSKEFKKKANKICTKEKVAGPLTHRLVRLFCDELPNISPLQEKQNVSDQDSESPQKRQKLEKSTPGDATTATKDNENSATEYLKNLPSYHTSLCFEKRIREGLEALGFFDDSPPLEENDEILKEIKTCQEEVRSCALHNITQLNDILKLAKLEVTRNQVRKKLHQIDAEIVEIYRRITAAKIKKEEVSRKDSDQAWKALEEREAIIKHLESLPCGLVV